MYTTNKEDQEKAAQLKARLAEQNAEQAQVSTSCDEASSAKTIPVPFVSLDEGANKYVLIAAKAEGKRQYFVCSSNQASYHRDAAEIMVDILQRCFYNEIEVLGGGRISLDSKERKISIFGYSYTFGQADHAISKSVVQADPRYKDFDVTTSSAGY